MGGGWLCSKSFPLNISFFFCRSATAHVPFASELDIIGSLAGLKIDTLETLYVHPHFQREWL